MLHIGNLAWLLYYQYNFNFVASCLNFTRINTSHKKVYNYKINRKQKNTQIDF